MEKKALLIIDMLNDFVKEGSPLEVPDTRKIIPILKKEIEKARTQGESIIYICDSHDKDDPEFKRFGWPPHAIKGTKGAEIIKEIAPYKGDYIVNKTTYSGFFKTKLESILNTLGIDTLRLTGCVTHICIMFTASDAVLRGYNVELLKEAVAGLSNCSFMIFLR